MNNITFNRGRGGLGRALDGKDHVSGIVLEAVAANIPAALQGEGSYQVIYSVQDAEDLGIEYSSDNSNLEIDALRYAIESIFAQEERAIVHLAVADTTNSGTAILSLPILQNKAGGDVRQAIVLVPATDFAIGDLAPIQAVCDTLEGVHKPLSVIYAPNFAGVDISSADLRTLDNKNVSVVYGMDGNEKGDELTTAYTKSFTGAGALIGVLAEAKVSENPAWVGQFNVNKNDTNEFDVVKLGDGRNIEDVSQTELDALNAKGFIFFIKHIGKAGSYFNDSHCAVAVTSDFAYIENNRTIDKAVRSCRTFLLDKLNSPLFVDDDGKLTEDTIASFKNDVERALEEMQRNEEVSAFSVTIDPAQNVLTSSKITITIKVVPVGVARNIEVNIGFAVRATN